LIDALELSQYFDELGPDELRMIQRMGSMENAIAVIKSAPEVDWFDGKTKPDSMEGYFSAVVGVADHLDRLIDEAVRGVDGRPFLCEWEGLSFRSKTEREIAKALDRASVIFTPNAKVRLGVTPDHRQTMEPDFLVVCEGKLGVLEVDGRDWHPPSRAAEEHERDRRFHEHGIAVVQRFDARRCYEMPDEVVAEFLRLLRLNG
jgi:hypothetical protein